MVTFEERHAAIIALHQNGLTCKDIAAKNIAPERTTYRIIKTFNCSEEGFRTSQSVRLLLRSQLWNRVTISAELAQYWQQVGECICTHSEAKTFGQWPGVKKGSKEATSLQENHQGKTEILQALQGMDSRRILQSCFL
ncbi:hypothetical protein DPX16_21016 [Anabarilius grahami]|uniref:Uncharacterized protein n=1 Tax=Anabarilius grahami TaxID=495550 RepID=A0A3N0YW77_ANAGA|nr:hypothetical protein DPX16_21016 [Anabarilius grahami]